MKRFVFTLQRVLGFKRTLFEKERSTLAHMRAERAALQQRRDGAERQLLSGDAAFRAEAAKGVRIDAVRAHVFCQDSAKRLITGLDEAIVRKDAEIEKQLQVVVALDKEVKSLEKLREHQWEAHRAEEAKEERERILEIVSGRFAAGQREARHGEAGSLARATNL